MSNIQRCIALMVGLVLFPCSSFAGSDAGGTNVTPATVTNCNGAGFVVETSSLGALRADFQGFGGMWFMVGPAPLKVTCLGRMFHPGNTGTHTVKLVDALNGLDVPGGTVAVNMAGGSANQFVYSSLPAPVTLQPNTGYYLVSEEFAGGDQFRDYAMTILKTTGAALCKDAVYKLSYTGWGNTGYSNRCYGPVNFLYEGAAAPVPSGPFAVATSSSPSNGGTTTGNGSYAGQTSVTVTATENPGFAFLSWTENGTSVSQSRSFTFNAETNRTLVAHFVPITVTGCASQEFVTGLYSLGVLRSDFTGLVGMWFRVGAQPLHVTCLARMFSEGNTGTHTVKLVRAADFTDVVGGSVAINMSGGAVNAFTYQPLPAPVTLEANTDYFLVTDELLGGDRWRDYRATTVLKTADATCVGAVYKLQSEWKPLVSPNHPYVPVNFRYQTTPVVPLPIVEVAASDAESSEVGPDTGTFTVTRSGSTAASLTVTISVGGNASSGADYLSLPASVTIGAGMASATLSVDPIDDPNFESAETVIVTVTPNSAYQIGAHGSATVTISSEDPRPIEPPTPQFTITTTGLPVGSGLTSGGGIVNSNSAVTVVATANPGNRFVDWSENGTRVSQSATYTFNAAASRNLVANFVPTVPGNCSGTTFVTSTTELGTLRADFTGRVGMWITVGADPLQVTCLGRQFSSGNSRTHTVKLVRASDVTDVPGGSVAIDMRGGPLDEFVYQSLATPVVLEANTDYYLVSEEESGGDKWRDHLKSVVTTAAGAVCKGAIYMNAFLPWTQVPSANHSFVLVDFKFQLAPLIPRSAVTIAATDPAAAELGLDTAILTISRTPPLSGPLTIPLAVTGTATAGTDYQSLPQSVTIPDGASSTTLAVVPLDDPTFEALENVKVALGPSASYTVGTPSSATVTIESDDVGSGPVMSCDGPSFATGMPSLGVLRRDFTGWVGMWFTTGPDSVEVTCLGRQFAPGNTRSHRVKLVRASDNVDVPGGATDIPMAGGTFNEIIYQTLPASVILAANTDYYLVTEETLGADEWRDYTSTVLTTRSEAICNGAVYGNSFIPWTRITSRNRVYGVVDFRQAPLGGGAGGNPAPEPAGMALEVVVEGGGVTIVASGPPGQNCSIEMSNDLVHWRPLGPLTLNNGLAELKNVSVGRGQQFYRAIGF